MVYFILKYSDFNFGTHWEILYHIIFVFAVSTTRSSQDNENHRFHQKTVVVPEICFACEKKIKFGKTALKCKGCKAIYHTECKNIISPLCLNTNDIKYVIKKTESISYYAPLETPMIPNIIISCIEEVEKRGLEEEGLYTVSRNQDDIKGSSIFI